ncbi:UDP-glycosyltransferase UGT5-like isoform X1 [Aricia agestis]|uniref:UDP-glycosyltransferase UGT5-like isoform X1 n=1 Tax=Aricia agestis TaxID=91739 RepID=UPI001C208CCB|nr:UDP-glycosyltransferase UGT5-like isoform X1 [Aricia agestis]
MKLCVIAIVISVSVINSEEMKPLNILAIFPFPGKSHGIIFNNLLEALVRRGHNLTHVSYFPINKPLKYYRHIHLAEDTSAKVLEDDFVLESSYSTILEVNKLVVVAGNENCKMLLDNKHVQKLWMEKTKFDLVVYEYFSTDCPLAIAHRLGAPVVGLTGCTLMAWQFDTLGVPFNPSFVPQQFLDGDAKPTLFQRIERTLFHHYFNLYYKLIGIATDEQTVKSYFDDVPSLSELARNVKIILMNTYWMLFDFNLLPPNVIEIGGFHVSGNISLPNKLLQFIEESEHGVIYVSFGSIIKSSVSDSDKIEKIVGALSKLPQRIIWKWEDHKPPGNLDKIYVSKWLPQKDILAHPKVLAFLSHCGLVSTTEAVTFGVPIVGMPIFGDQPTNAAAIEEKGFGVRVQLSELTSEHLLEKFKTVLDPHFRAKVKSLSKSWQDRPMKPMETAIFWTEFAARHPNHTFRAPAADVPLYQYLNLDILLVFIVFAFTVFLGFKYLISVVFINVARNSNKAKKQ